MLSSNGDPLLIAKDPPSAQTFIIKEYVEIMAFILFNANLSKTPLDDDEASTAKNSIS